MPKPFFCPLINFQTGQNEIFQSVRELSGRSTHRSSFNVKSIFSMTSEDLLIQGSASAVCHSLSDIISTCCAKNLTKAVLEFAWIFRLFPFDHTVGCCNISFSCWLPVSNNEGKNCFASNVSTFLLYFLNLPDCSCLDATFGQFFTLRPPIFFCFSSTL